MRFGFCHATFTFSYIFFRIFAYYSQLRVYYLLILLLVDFNIDLSIMLINILVFNLVLSVVLATARGLRGHTIIANGNH